MNYLNEIAEIFISFHDKNNGEKNLKKYTQKNVDILKYHSSHSLSLIYKHGLSTKIKKDLLKALKYVKIAGNMDSHSLPYYTRKKYKIKKKLFHLGVFEDNNKLIKLEKKVFELYDKNKDYDKYGNSYYYYFGKLYENGIGTRKNDKKALAYYQKGCQPFYNLFDNFVIAYKRYLSLKKINLNKYKFKQIDSEKINVFFCLSLRDVPISLSIYKEMTINDIKVELYKRPELQNLIIKFLLFNGTYLKDNETIEKYNIKQNDKIVVMVEISQNLSFNY